MPLKRRYQEFSETGEAKLSQLKRNQKYKSKKTEYKGVLYDSANEAGYAYDLDRRVEAGEIREWRRQERIPLTVNGVKVCAIVVDFVEVGLDGSETLVEYKGFATPVWRLKWKLLGAVYPELRKMVVR